LPFFEVKFSNFLSFEKIFKKFGNFEAQTILHPNFRKILISKKLQPLRTNGHFFDNAPKWPFCFYNDLAPLALMAGASLSCSQTKYLPGCPQRVQA
jgi:hypothetical protein